MKFLAGAWFLAVAAVACGAVPVDVQCQLDAVQALPLLDPDAISVGDARELARRLKACAPQGDAGP